MQDYLRHYRLKITALSPIHVGDGTQIGKKEYFRDRARKIVTIPNKEKMFSALRKLNRESAFEDFMLHDKDGDLMHWFNYQRLDPSYIGKWAEYTLEAGDAFVEARRDGKVSTPKDIKVFMKDPYGDAFIPGSSLKGMIRTALIAREIKQESQKYITEIKRLKNTALAQPDPSRRINAKTFLKRETDTIEAAVFNILSRDEKRKSNAVNSVMSGLIVSDSKPISTAQLTLCQKVDCNIRGGETALPILRESLIPGTEVIFDITIDEELFPFTIEDIMEALDVFNANCYEYFYRYFGRGSVKQGTVWLGGGTGFLSKTLVYQIYGGDGLELADAVFKKTIGKNYRIHKHDADIRNGISPHVCKCTYYHGRLYDMGMGKLEILNM